MSRRCHEDGEEDHIVPPLLIVPVRRNGSPNRCKKEVKGTMKHHLLLTTSAAALVFTVATAQANSTGFLDHYAPKTWTITGAGIGGSSAIFAADGSELTITDSDGGIASTIQVTHAAIADGVWSFHWHYVNPDPCTWGFDAAYYLINGESEFLSTTSSGTVTVPIQAGDVIGWQIISIDGIFGSAVLTITDFRAPVPASAAFALLSLAALPRARRRR